MPKTFLQFKNNLHTILEELDEIPDYKSTDRYNTSTDPSKAANKPKGLLGHLVSSAKGVVRNIGRNYFRSAMRTVLGDEGDDWARTTLLSKDIDDQKRENNKLIDIHMQKKSADDAELKYHRDLLGKVNDPKTKQEINDKIKAIQKSVNDRNRFIHSLRQNNMQRDTVLRNLHGTGEAEGRDPLKYMDGSRSPLSSGSKLAKKRGFYSTLKLTNPDLFRKVKAERVKLGFASGDENPSTY